MTKTENSDVSCRSTLALQCFLTGLGTGVALTLLLAPLSGTQTRRLIGNKAKAGQNWAKDKAEAAGEYVVSRGEGLRDRAKEVAEVITR